MPRSHFCFLNSAFKYAPPHEIWPPRRKAQHKLDLAQAQYSQQDIENLATNWAALCSKCLQWGHSRVNCEARLICINCSGRDHKAFNCPECAIASDLNRQVPSISNRMINPTGPFGASSSAHKPTRPSKPSIRCATCGFYGHEVRAYKKLKFQNKWR